MKRAGQILGVIDGVSISTELSSRLRGVEWSTAVAGTFLRLNGAYHES
jgi:hypothetical protein